MSIFLQAQNPIVPNKGLNDPHIHIFNDTAYVYASHDKSIDNKDFVMEDWWVWSSPDLVNWTQRSVLKPTETYIGKQFSSCWATDVAFKNGKYYWYFSEANEQTGVVVGDSPVGPWSAPLGKPLLQSNLTPTHEYDICVFEEDGNHYIIFGVWDYYIAKLNADMISLAEKPRKIKVNNPKGPYNLDGRNLEKPTDDKPFLHKHNDKYYLSWGCFYAMADQLYGPYDYKDSVIKKESFAKGYEKPTWPTGFLQGRHGSFFEWHNQWYYVYCDISQTGNRYFRDSFISYVHYKENGEMATIRVDGVGVANYKASKTPIEAEDYFKSHGFIKKEGGENFVVQTNEAQAYLYFPHVKGLKNKTEIQFNFQYLQGGTLNIVVRKNSDSGLVLASKTIALKPKVGFQTITLQFKEMASEENLFFMIEQTPGKKLMIDNFSFK
ncbi:family 43 glycosylhydrolase [Pseudotamlana carrageenivorans]|uniref:CBM6 domain-containing protein n=1 Tax=Pseudotamlana carrageenivorans TaxID=2069432 RepID=A0A2I7SK43_9FLAO|nr:family 43 glycosylhydrolase [Tamlana carrageenivorans]AUS06276.1 hypothetical protein C1A40_12835 [Tamlana carrageenivorans]